MDAERVMALAEKVAAGSGVDWGAEAETSGDDAEREIIRSMGLLAQIADLHAHGADASVLAAIDGRRPDAPSEELPSSRRWGPLEQLQYIGRGSFGVVCKAWDPKLQIWVALKLARRDTEHSEQTERMLEEARLMARVRHENVVRIYGTDAHEGRPGIWMEFIEGRTLDAIVKFEGRLNEQQVTDVGRTLALALAAIHEKGVIHKDIKAHNVMRESGGRLVLMDFGASARVEDIRSEFDIDPLRGTPYYLAPELLDDYAPSIQSDIYSLGVLLFYLATARYPIEAENFADLLEAHRRRLQSLVDLRPDLGQRLIGVVTRALQAEPPQRYESAGRLAQDLSLIEGTRVHPWRIAATALLASVFMAIGWWQCDKTISFRVEASLFRLGHAARQELISGARVTPGDQLFLELEATRSLHVYIVNQDEQGVASLLFPITGLQPSNPLEPGRRHHLPGQNDSGDLVFWTVTSAGGRERFLMIASPAPLRELEELIADIPQPTFGHEIAYPAVPTKAINGIRGIMGLAPRETSPASGVDDDLYAQISELTAGQNNERGIWIRKIELEN